ncbi:MAG TPA: hypothetical protein VHT73_15485 [Thermodesulfobacteriota bacterium]|nr:hypothetical protein [Thermodesulfobacteriota bacterium]
MPKLQTLTESYTNILSYLALFVSLFGLGISAILVKWANAPGVISAFYRVAIATAIMTIPFGVQVKRSGSLKRNHILWAVLAGVFFACDLGTWHPSGCPYDIGGKCSSVWQPVCSMGRTSSTHFV